MKNKTGDSTIVGHARRELERAGAFSKVDMDVSDIGRGTLALIKLFDSWCKGDQNKMKAISDAFQLLINGALLSPPTTDPSEWEIIDSTTPEQSWRSVRSPFYVSTDKGKTWTHIPTGTTGNSVNKEASDVDIQQEENTVSGSDGGDASDAAAVDAGASSDAPNDSGSGAKAGSAKASTPPAGRKKKRTPKAKGRKA